MHDKLISMRLLLTPFNGIFTGTILLFGLGVYVVTQLYDAPTFFVSSFYSRTFHYASIFYIYAFINYRILRIIFIVRPKKLFRTILQDMKSFFSAERILTALPVIIIIPFFFSIFTSAKNMIPVVNHFSWDPVIANLDIAVHLGRHPWEWLQPILGITIISLIISFSYKMWFIIKFLVVYWQAFSLTNSGRREQFFISFLLIWIVNGVILATIFSSAGPCYYGNLYPDIINPYEDLMKYLYAVPIYDLKAQEFLWNAYTGQTPVAYSGISAMPSMHVSLACLFALLGWQVGGYARWAYLTFLVLTFLGSIHLGWHYAADGYLSLLTTPLLWWLAGKIVGLYRYEIIPDKRMLGVLTNENLNLY